MQGINFIQDLAIVVLVAGVVGWICQRLRLSVVVGYLAAGMLVGPYTPPFTLVSNISRIGTLAQVGLIFLMFSIGLRLSLRKLRRLGFALVLATLVEANIIYNLSRLARHGARLEPGGGPVSGGHADGFQLGGHQQGAAGNAASPTKRPVSMPWAWW